MAPWILVLSQHTIQKGHILQIYFSVIFHETMHFEQTHITSGAFIHCALSLAVRSTQTAAHLGWWFHWPVFVMATLESQNIFCTHTWSYNQSGVGVILAVFSFLNFLTRRSRKSLSVYLAPQDNSFQLLGTVRSRRWKNNFMVLLLLDRQKDEYLCSFLEAVSRLVISHLLQAVVRLPLRPAAAATVVVLLP